MNGVYQNGIYFIMHVRIISTSNGIYDERAGKWIFGERERERDSECVNAKMRYVLNVEIISV